MLTIVAGLSALMLTLAAGVFILLFLGFIISLPVVAFRRIERNIGPEAASPYRAVLRIHYGALVTLFILTLTVFLSGTPNESFICLTLVPMAASPLVGAGMLQWSRGAHRLQHQRLLCRKCGYDLTGNVSGTCPECGTPVK